MVVWTFRYLFSDLIQDVYLAVKCSVLIFYTYKLFEALHSKINNKLHKTELRKAILAYHVGNLEGK